MQSDQTEKPADVSVIVKLHPGLAAYMAEVAERRGQSLAEIVKGEVELQWYSDSGLPASETLDGLFPGFDDEAKAWERTHHPPAPEQEDTEPHQREGPCAVAGCEEKRATSFVITRFPSDEDEVAIASGKEFALISPICAPHRLIFEAASSQTEVADAITKVEVV